MKTGIGFLGRVTDRPRFMSGIEAVWWVGSLVAACAVAAFIARSAIF